MPPLATRTTAYEDDARPPMTRRMRPGDHIARAVAIEAITEHRGADVDPARIFKSDEVTPLLTRAATSPATLASAGWAGVLASQSVADFIVGLAPMSAASALIAAGLRVPLDGFGSVQVPSRLMVAADAGGFIGEGQPFAVRQFNLTSGPVLSPYKFGVITAFTAELMDRAVSDFEAVVRQMLAEASALALDAALLSSIAGSAIRPAGILNGVAPIAQTAGGGTTALARDIENLIGAISAIGGGQNVLIVASPQKAAALKSWAGPRFDFPILASAALPAGTVVAVDASLFVSAFDATPEFRSSTEAVLHYEDANPLQLVTGAQGSGVSASPARSLFRTNCVAVRMTLKTGWALRVAGAAQHTSQR